VKTTLHPTKATPHSTLPVLLGRENLHAYALFGIPTPRFLCMVLSAVTAGSLGGDMDKPLSDRERKRIDRFERTWANRRGRSQPAVLPSTMARTGAFSPRRYGLNTDSTFARIYTVRPHSVVEVRGRELGTQHRDILYALFRLRARKEIEPNPAYNPNITGPEMPGKELVYFHTQCTWRDLLRATGKTAHVNNLGTLLRSLEELRAVSIRVYTGTWDQYVAASKRGRLSGPGFSDSILGLIEWDGVSLDSQVTVKYGEWVKRMFEARNLISLNSEVYIKLTSDYARTFWPFIDSQNGYTFLDAETLAELAGRDYWSETTRQRIKFREDIRQAFDDMVKAGGLTSWRSEQTGSGRKKSYRYHYIHALPRQGTLELEIPEETLF
jgi:hypothetical protein